MTQTLTEHMETCERCRVATETMDALIKQQEDAIALLQSIQGKHTGMDLTLRHIINAYDVAIKKAPARCLYK
jgi:hypothetical protein